MNIFLVVIAAATLRPLSMEGTICRMNRAVDRLIVATDAGARVRVALARSTPVYFATHVYERGDLRLGDRIHLFAERGGSGLTARNIDVTMRTGDALLDSILRSRRTVIGRFAGREGKSEFFSLNLLGDGFLRVDAQGKVKVGSLKPGDLLEVRGSWPSKDLLRARSINVITNYEPSFCISHARRREIQPETAAREAGEERFLAHADRGN